MSTPFDRTAPCPSCGAPITFRFAAARAQVCAHCRFVVARTDRELVATGRVADLVEIPSPFHVGASGTWKHERFFVEGRLQLDRESAPGAPWQEIYLCFESGRWCWLAFAQGRWYATTRVEGDVPLPPLRALAAGQGLELPGLGRFQVVEVGRRRVLSGEGGLPDPVVPGAIEAYADLEGPQGAFGTLDYGDGRSPPRLYLGARIDPTEIRLDGGAPVEPAAARAEALACPHCGGNLPLVTPGTTLRVVCRYCGTVSDLRQGALFAMAQVPKPPEEPAVPLGAEGTLRGLRVISIGYLIRGTTVEGERYRWREYLLYAGPQVGYLWLTEEDGVFRLVHPLSAGEVSPAGRVVHVRGAAYLFKQEVVAEVEYVLGEFYWKVVAGERVVAVEYQGRAGSVHRESTEAEVNWSFAEPLRPAELRAAFGPAVKLPRVTREGKGPGVGAVMGLLLLLLLVIVVTSVDDCDGAPSGVPAAIVGVPSFGGGK